MSSLMIREELEKLDVIVKMLRVPKDQLEGEEEEVEEDLQELKEPLKQRKNKLQFNNNNHKRLELTNDGTYAYYP